MPELPEVETVRLGLARELSGRRIEEVKTSSARMRYPVDAKALQSLRGRRLRDFARRAKYLLLQSDGPRLLVLHLGMSGQLRLVDASSELSDHVHLQILFDDGRELRLRDPRRFGWMAALVEAKLESHPRFRDLGPEPLSEDFQLEPFHRRARGRRGSIKSFIMDAKTVVGVGNIYACEALFAAGIHPARAAGRISKGRMSDLRDEIQRILESAIENGGTTFSDFISLEGSRGENASRLLVYGREGEDCRRCSRSLRRIVQGARSTFFCPGCQR